MESVSPCDSTEGVIEDPEDLSIDLIAACHLSDDVLQRATAQERIEACSKLTHARLDELQLQYLNWDTLSQLTACRSLYLQHNKLTSTATLAALPHLSFLTLSDNQLQQVEGLQGLTTLLFLDVSFNFIEQLDCTQLPDSIKYLKVAGNPCCSQPGCKQQLLAHFPRLKELDFGCVDDEQPVQIAATSAADAAESSDESETEECDSPAAMMGSYLLGMQQLEHLYTRSTPRMQQIDATTNMQDVADNSQPNSDSVVATAMQDMVAKADSSQSSNWVPDAGCSKQLSARLVLNSSPRPPLQSSMTSSEIFNQICMEPSSLISPRPCSMPSLPGFRPGSSSSLSAASLTEATAENSTAAQQLSDAGSIRQHKSSRSGSGPDGRMANTTRQPRVLCRPQSAQNAGYLSVQPKLGGVTALCADNISASIASVRAAQQYGQQEVRQGQSRKQSKPSVATAAQRGGAAVQSRGQTAPAAVPKRDVKAARSKAAAFSSKGASTSKAVGASLGETPVAPGNASAPPKQSGSAGQTDRSNHGAASKGTTSSSSNSTNNRHSSNSKVKCGSLPSSRRTSAAALPLSSNGAASPLPPVDAGRPGPVSTRKLPSLSRSTSAAAKAAAIAAAAVDQPLAALLQPEPLSRPSSARRLAPVEHPALSRPGESAANSMSGHLNGHTAARVVSQGSRSGSLQDTPLLTTSQAGAHAAAPAVSTTRGASEIAASIDGVAKGILAAEPSTTTKIRRSMAELVPGDARASIVLDRSQALQGCKAPLQATTQSVLAIEASSSSRLQTASGRGSAAPDRSTLDELADISREALSSTVLAIRQRTKQRTRELLQQHNQELVAIKQGRQQASRQQLLQQTDPLDNLVRKPSASTASGAGEQQQLLAQPIGIGPQFSGPDRVTSNANKDPKPRSDNQLGVPLRKTSADNTTTQGNSEGKDQDAATPAVTVLCTALTGLQGLRSRLGQDNSSSSLNYKPAGTQIVAHVAGAEPLDLASKLDRLRLQFAAASAQLQQAAAAAESAVATQILQDGLNSGEDQPDHSLPPKNKTAALSTISVDSLHTQPAPQTQQHGRVIDNRSGSAARHSLVDSSDMDLDTELQGVLDKIFKSSLPSDQHVEPPDSDTTRIPSALFTSKLPQMVP